MLPDELEPANHELEFPREEHTIDQDPEKEPDRVLRPLLGEWVMTLPPSFMHVALDVLLAPSCLCHAFMSSRFSLSLMAFFDGFDRVLLCCWPSIAMASVLSLSVAKSSRF